METTTKPDGTKVQTETKEDGTKVETTTAKDGSTSKTTTNPNGSSVTETKAADGSTGTVKTDKHGQTTAETQLSGKTVETAKKNGEPVKAPVVDTTPAIGQNWYDKGIRVSELRYITMEAALAGRATITLNCDSPVTRQKVTRHYK